MSSNPYAAPKAPVADAAIASQGNFVPGGHGVEAGHGWNWIVGGWELFKKQPGMWIGLIIVALIITIVLAIIPFIGSLALMIIGPVFGGGIMLGCKALSEGGELELGHLFAGFKERFGSLAAIGAIYLVASIVIALVVGLVTGAGIFALMSGGRDPSAGQAAGAVMGMMLAVLIMFALLLPVWMAIWFAPALVVLNQRGAVEAMKESFWGCLKNIIPMLVYSVILFVAAIIAAIPLGLGWLVLGPVLAGSLYASYRDIYYTA
jgi:uncharacterized membrane protein